LSREELRGWVEHLLKEPIGPNRQVQHFAALRFFFGKTLGRPEMTSFLSYPRVGRRLPVVLSGDEVLRLLHAVETPKYRVLFATMYAAGLRVSEACHLRVDDIDAARGVLHVRHGKGDKERVTILSPTLLALLRKHWRRERPPLPYLFVGRTGKPMRRDFVSEVIQRAAATAGITKRVTPHVLRHTFATRVHEGGGRIEVIQELLGHASIETTRRYTHVSAATIAKTPSPLDQLLSR
jgi:site-specific recombinase XerD